jgi:uncharacterized protein (TIGR03435 family)
MEWSALLAIAFCARAIAQQPAFEVASVKNSTPQDRIIALSTYPGGRITITNYTVHAMLEEAFQLQPFQIVGGPRWLLEERYNVEAKPPVSSESAKSNPPYTKSPPNREQRRMLQSLLIDRFQLAFHRENREGPVYLLSRGAKALKLQPTREPDAYAWAGSLAGGGFAADGMRGTNITMAQLAERLGPYLQHPVIDQTGLAGPYDFRVEYSSDGDRPNNDRPDVVASIFSCISDLGLKLRAAKAPIETLVIDRAEKPTAN